MYKTERNYKKGPIRTALGETQVTAYGPSYSGSPTPQTKIGISTGQYDTLFIRSGTNTPGFRALLRSSERKKRLYTTKLLKYRNKEAPKRPEFRTMKYTAKVYFVKYYPVYRKRRRKIDPRGPWIPTNIVTTTYIKKWKPKLRFKRVTRYRIVMKMMHPKCEKLVRIPIRPKRLTCPSGFTVAPDSTLFPNALNSSFSTFKCFPETGTVLGKRTYAGKPEVANWKGEIWGLPFYYPTAWNTNCVHNSARPDDTKYFDNSNSLLTANAAEITKLSDRALGKLQDKIRGKGPNMALIFAERAQTAALLIDSMKRIGKMMLGLKRGNLSSIASFFGDNPKAFASTWLAYQYGVKPLISDVNSILAALDAEKAIQFDEIAVSTTTTSEKFSYQSYKKAFVDDIDVVKSVTVKYKVCMRVDSPGVRVLSELGMTNPLSITWELIPFSFVADWFVKIGEYLDRTHAIDGMSVVYLQKTTVVKQTSSCKRTFNSNGDDNGWKWEGPQAGWSWDSFVVKREIVSPSLLTKPPMPRITNPFSGTHVANAIALFTLLRKTK